MFDSKVYIRMISPILMIDVHELKCSCFFVKILIQVLPFIEAKPLFLNLLPPPPLLKLISTKVVINDFYIT